MIEEAVIMAEAGVGVVAVVVGAAEAVITTAAPVSMGLCIGEATVQNVAVGV
jgi:hypothetical protein